VPLVKAFLAQGATQAAKTASATPHPASAAAR